LFSARVTRPTTGCGGGARDLILAPLSAENGAMNAAVAKSATFVLL
jgi:hypothetical protein